MPNNYLQLFSRMCVVNRIGLRCCLGLSWAPELRVRIPFGAAYSHSPCDVSMPLRGLQQLSYHNFCKNCYSLVAQTIGMWSVVIHFVCHKLYYCCHLRHGK